MRITTSILLSVLCVLVILASCYFAKQARAEERTIDEWLTILENQVDSFEIHATSRRTAVLLQLFIVAKTTFERAEKTELSLYKTRSNRLTTMMDNIVKFAPNGIKSINNKRRNSKLDFIIKAVDSFRQETMANIYYSETPSSALFTIEMFRKIYEQDLWRNALYSTILLSFANDTRAKCAMRRMNENWENLIRYRHAYLASKQQSSRP